MRLLRIGQGIDFHGFRRGGPGLTLCGHFIEGVPGLDGHSDADVGLHAVADAILGAVAAGDIGEHFPDSEAEWKGADSSVFVAGALERAAAKGFRLANCDLTIVGEYPRVAAHRRALRSSLAAILGVETDAVSVKATTTDGLGFLGRGEGLGAIAVVLMEGATDDG